MSDASKEDESGAKILKYLWKCLSPLLWSFRVNQRHIPLNYISWNRKQSPKTLAVYYEEKGERNWKWAKNSNLDILSLSFTNALTPIWQVLYQTTLYPFPIDIWKTTLLGKEPCEWHQQKLLWFPPTPNSIDSNFYHLWSGMSAGSIKNVTAWCQSYCLAFLSFAETFLWKIRIRKLRLQIIPIWTCNSRYMELGEEKFGKLEDWGGSAWLE